MLKEFGRMRHLRLLLAFALAGTVFATSAHADIITYSLSDKDPGAQNPPDYGLRVDGLFGDESSIWTFSFNSTDVKMVIDTGAETAHIFGEVIGAKDVGTEWDPIIGYTWDLDFWYTDIIVTDPTTGYWHAADVGGDHKNILNNGSLELLSNADVDGDSSSDQGKFIGLVDYKGGDFFFHGSKGPYVSAWHASTPIFVADASVPPLTADDYTRFGACCKDFGFKATRVPEPSTLTLLLSGLLGLGFVRRGRAA